MRGTQENTAVSSRVVRAKIHPGIGIARLGNSENEFFVGPEVQFPQRMPSGFYKDASGAIKRQAARFRLYGYDDAGNVVDELDASNARIVWTVHVANKKAAWYNFEGALDIPEAVPCARRNAGFTGDRRKELAIDPGPRSIPGASSQAPIPFDSGTFLGTTVYLGELRTDDRGNLLVLGGRGVSASAFPNHTAYTFANNDGWHDDIADGPVRASVEIDGRSIPVDPAWVVVAPPNYAPDVVSVRTMYDLLYDAYQYNWITTPAKPSFTEHIYPMLRQFCDTQWVNWGFYLQFGWGAPNEFVRPDYVYKLATITRDSTGITDLYKDLRVQLFHWFRNPVTEMDLPAKWPPVHGDAAGMKSPRANLTLTQTQYTFLQQWANGDFVDDWAGELLIKNFDQFPLADRPAMLDRAALWFCMGGPFHPGCEMTWPMRTYTMYYAPFRVRVRPSEQPEPDYGDFLTPQAATSEYGPLTASGPGDLTRWMAVPWQTDSASCYAGSENFDPYLPTWWPARVPNHVLAEAQYDVVFDRSRGIEERERAFDTRSVWMRYFAKSWLDRINQMVTDFGKLGIVERRDAPGDERFPSEIFVESQVGFEGEVYPLTNLHAPPIEKLRWLRRRHERLPPV
jgi:hypothetical protein